MTSVTKRIVIAEDHAILREGLRILLSLSPMLEVVGEAQNGLEAIRSVESLKPDLILIDLSMPILNGVEAIQEIKKLNPSTKILVLTVHKTEEHVLSALKAGVDGYIVKDASRSELMLAIENVLSGRRHLSPEISGEFVNAYEDGTKNIKTATAWETLSPRERQILKMIAEGYRNRDIANYFSISIKTVEKHRANLMRKLNLHNIPSLTAFAIQKGLVR